MACPFFEPQAVAANPRHANARLPLIQEYDGACHAAAEPFTAPPEHRFSNCNHGYSRAACGRFPIAETRSALRYTVVKDSGGVLEIICIEERDHTPVAWHPARFSVETGLLEPAIPDTCMRAQALAFCRSYLARFSSNL